jgi:septal ring factor EnvC (AmiA/AmiB activator)
MKQGLLGAGWIVAILVAVASWVQIGKLRDQIDESDSNVAVVEEDTGQLAKMKNDIDSLQAKLEATKKTVTDLESEKKTVSEELASLQAEFEKVETMVVGEEVDPEEAAKKAADAARRKEAQRGVMTAQATAITELTYAKMFSDLQLDGDLEEDITAVLVDRLMDQMISSQEAMKAGDVLMSEVAAEMEAQKLESLEQMREFLDDETYEKVAAYEENADRHQLEGTLMAQLDQLSSGLTPENREFVGNLVVDVFDQHQKAFFESDKIFNLYENADWQIIAMDDILGQLESQLDAQQLGEVERWFKIGKTQMEALKKR